MARAIPWASGWRYMESTRINFMWFILQNWAFAFFVPEILRFWDVPLDIFGQNSKNIWCWKLGSPRPPPQQPPPRRGEGRMGKWQMENGLAVSSSFVAISHWQQGRLERNEAGGVSIVVMQAGRKTQSCGTFCSSFHVVSLCFCYVRNLNESKLSFGSERLTRDSPEIVLELLVRFTSWHP